jgi:hypothetical protein
VGGILCDPRGNVIVHYVWGLGDEGWIEVRPMLVVSPLPARSCLVSSSITCVLLPIWDCKVYELDFKNSASFWIAGLTISSPDNYPGISFLEALLCFLIWEGEDLKSGFPSISTLFRFGYLADFIDTGLISGDIPFWILDIFPLCFF